MSSKTIQLNPTTRRTFMKTSALAAAATLASSVPLVGAAGPQKIRVAVIGCGGRGVHDTTNCLKSAENVELVAMGDLFKEQIDWAYNKLKGRLGNKVVVKPEHRFSGMDCHEKVCALDNVDLVILTQPPGFRPLHFETAVNAGKHVFMEKPVATDPVGVRRVIAAGELAKKKGLSVVAGTQARRMKARQEVMKRIHDGAIGKIVAAQCYRVGGAMRGWRGNTKNADLNTFEGQVKRWLFVNWLSGDFISEMHIHELDVLNWGLGGPPETCFGLGGRQQRIEPEFGNIYDHFSVDFVYPGNVKASYMGAQIDNTSGPGTYERFIGTKGEAYTSWATSHITGENPYKFTGRDSMPPDVRQHAEHIASIRAGKPLNEARRVAESTMTAIIARTSAYTGRRLKWQWIMERSKLDLFPKEMKFGPLKLRPVAIPGVTKVI